jgi:hypothetical protein
MRVPLSIAIPDDVVDKMGRLKLRFDFLQVLPAEKMQEILEKTLIAKGWVKTDSGLVKETPGKTRWIIDPEKQEITVDVSGTVQKEVDVMVDSDYVDRQGYVEGRVKELMDQLDAQTRRRLIVEMAGARNELNRELKNVYREAIKEKASTLGNVTSVAESTEGGNYRIRLEIQ